MSKPRITRKKTGDRAYNLMAGGRVVATAVQTGEHGRDHYPWEWLLEDDLYQKLKAEHPEVNAHLTQGSLETLRDCVDYAATVIGQYGLLDPA